MGARTRAPDSENMAIANTLPTCPPMWLFRIPKIRRSPMSNSIQRLNVASSALPAWSGTSGSTPRSSFARPVSRNSARWLNCMRSIILTYRDQNASILRDRSVCRSPEIGPTLDRAPRICDQLLLFLCELNGVRPFPVRER